ncbi:MAG: mannosyltransferase [Acidobacteriaceae bacterium]|nr:mannosyltransferase [Acidobacteriaceae bacterium]
MEALPTASGAQGQKAVAFHTQAAGLGSGSDGIQYAIYSIILAISISIWLFAIRTPLWLDETVSIYLIKGGFAGIISRQVWPDSPVYSCLLWLWTKALGTSEISLRISSLLPMLLAVYLLYRAARELFERDLAILAAVIFCLHPIIISASIDVRPYAFAALAVNATILVLVLLRNNNTTWMAALFGLLAASIVQFQLLFASILPALLICFVALKLGDRKVLWRQLSVAVIVFTVASIPIIPRLQYMAHTSGTHVFSPAPKLYELGSTLTLHGLALVLVLLLLIAAATKRLNRGGPADRWTVLLCLSLALVPILILYGLSAGTSIHVFVPRYRLESVAGIALSWTLLASRLNSRVLRLLFCMAVVAATCCRYMISPPHSTYTWKYALQAIQKNASSDGAPVLICSDIPEADYMRMPIGPAIEESGILPPISYYKITVPVVALPRALNDEATRVGSQFLQQAEQQHERFLAAAFAESYATLNWLATQAAETYDVRNLGNFDGVRVLEFVPRTRRDPLR